MDRCLAEDWDGHVGAEVWRRVHAQRLAGHADPAVLLVSRRFAHASVVNVSLGAPRFAPSRSLIVPADQLGLLLDEYAGPGVGAMVLGVKLADPAALRGVLLLPATVEVLALRKRAEAVPAWPVCVIDLAGRRLHVRERDSWRSHNVLVQARD